MQPVMLRSRIPSIREWTRCSRRAWRNGSGTSHRPNKKTHQLKQRRGSWHPRSPVILILIFSAALEEAVVATKREQHTWFDLEHKLAPEVFRAPKTCGDPDGMGAWPGVDSRIISYLE